MEIKNPNHNILKGYNMLIYFAGSMIMNEPTEECVVDFWHKDILMKLPVSSSNPNFTKAASQLRDSCSDATVCSKILCEDYFRLFSRHDLPLAPAYESKYISDLRLQQGYHNSAVTEFYDSYGWKSRFSSKIDDDHLGVELLFLTIMIDKYLVMDDEVCIIEMKGEIRRFIYQHLLSWIHNWNDKMQEHSKTLCYKGIATLIYACIEDIYAILDNNSADITEAEYLKN